MEIKEPSILQDYLDGVLTGSDVQTSAKLFKDAKGFYENSDCELADDTVMYEVYSYSKGDPKQAGNLNWGLTVMKPVYVNHECNITRGHFHKDLNCAEMYFCLHGEGLLLLMDTAGNCHAEKMFTGSVHHIDGTLAHRLVNTGKEELRVGACWPTTAGHDYARIEREPFKVRIYKENDTIIVRERTK